MSRATTYLLLLIPVLLWSSYLQAQSGSRIEVKADRSRILIGEPILLSLRADIPENEPIRFFRIDSLPHFEILDRGRIDTSNTGDGTRLQQQIRITSFDSGSRAIPPLPLNESIVSDSIPVEVSYSPFNPDQPYHDIHDIIEVAAEEEESTPWWWYAAGAAAVLAIIFYLVFRKSKKPPVVIPPPPRDPYREAQKALHELQQSNLDDKAWFTQLVDIFRMYADERKGIRSLQQTSEDLVRQLKSIPFSATAYDELTHALRTGDLVKFAKYEAGRSDRDQAFAAITEAIQQLEGMN